jgi:flagellar motor switch protein FliN
MPRELSRILSLEVPVIVRLGERSLTVREVMALVPGTIIELPKSADEELDLLVNNKQIGVGAAVKVGENFGLRITFIGDARDRIRAMGAGETDPSDADLDAIAESMIAPRG